MITLSPAAPSDSNKTKLLSSQTGARIRDVSFSSYLDGAEETFIHKLAESGEETFKSHNPKCHGNHDLYLISNNAEEDDEIDVFNADKYFNGQGDEISPGFDNKGIHQIQNTNPELELYEIRRLIQSAGTPSISSKSSLNSRSSLLLQQSIPQKTNSRSNKKNFFSKLGCNCNDKNSVNIIDDNHHQLGITSSSNCSSGRRRPLGKTGDYSNMIGHQNQTNPCGRKDMQSRKVEDPGIEISRGEDFMFPVLKLNRQEEDAEDGARKSLEVFGTDVQRSRKLSGVLSVERKLNMLRWDGIDIEIPSKSYKDSDSDASSDLFEIESFSTNPSQYFTTNTSDAPSEASIDWSVVTATARAAAAAADFAVMYDNSEELTRDYGSAGLGKSKRHSSILSGCYSHKAVMVVGDQLPTPRH